VRPTTRPGGRERVFHQKGEKNEYYCRGGKKRQSTIIRNIEIKEEMKKGDGRGKKIRRIKKLGEQGNRSEGRPKQTYPSFSQDSDLGRKGTWPEELAAASGISPASCYERDEKPKKRPCGATRCGGPDQ